MRDSVNKTVISIIFIPYIFTLTDTGARPSIKSTEADNQ